MIKMIVTDLDETLLRNDKTISGYTIDVLQQCRARGIITAFATARSAQAAARFLDMFTPDIFIGYGGGLVAARQTAGNSPLLPGMGVIGRFDIPAEVSNQIIRACLDTPSIVSILASNDTIAITNNPALLAEKDSAHYQYADLSVAYPHRYLKISVVSADPEAVAAIATRFPLCDMLRYTGEDLYRFAHRSAVKWNAVQAAAAYCNIDTRHIAAFGDDINDREMIEKCGLGIAVANAVDAVKEAAAYICDTNNNDGVAKWLAKNGVC